jgi:sigma-B regulation protein RsbU (phosphoserine phosphatase)
MAYFLENTSYTAEELNDFLRSVVQNNDEIYGATIAFEPYMFDPGKQRYAPYFYKDDKGQIQFSDLADEAYSYFYWDWYQIPRELGRPLWSEPYFDEGGGDIVMSTHSVPFYRVEKGQRRLAGIITADISLSWLEQIVESIKIAKTGYGFVITKNGAFVVHPNKKLVMNETIFCLAEDRNDKGLRELGRDMIHGKSGFVPFRSTVTEKMCWMVFAPSQSSGWSVGVLFPQDELMTDMTRMNRTVLVIGITGMVFLFAVIILVAQTITRPLRLLAGAARTIATGDLNSHIPPVTARDEVGELADSLDYMKVSLKKYIEDLTEATAARERIESELQVAHDIQMGILAQGIPALS